MGTEIGYQIVVSFKNKLDEMEKGERKKLFKDMNDVWTTEEKIRKGEVCYVVCFENNCPQRTRKIIQDQLQNLITPSSQHLEVGSGFHFDPEESREAETDREPPELLAYVGTGFAPSVSVPLDRDQSQRFPQIPDEYTHLNQYQFNGAKMDTSSFQLKPKDQSSGESDLTKTWFNIIETPDGVILDLKIKRVIKKITDLFRPALNQLQTKLAIMKR